MDVPAETGLADVLEACLEPEAEASALAWLREGSGHAFERGAFFTRYAGAARRFRGVFAPTHESASRLEAIGLALPERVAKAELARIVLLVRAVSGLPEPERVALVTEVFRRGDSAERVALLRALPLLPHPSQFTELAIEACRTQVPDVFAAIACENLFPARHFPELNFNQLVIKALFLELPLSRVRGWRARANPELRRIAADYEAERRAAGRSVPADIAQIKATEQVP